MSRTRSGPRRSSLRAGRSPLPIEEGSTPHMLEIFESIENENELAILANNNVAPEIEFSWDED
ncbi:hypothetical protein GCM10027258_88780 [Amycolatopsis stemonae]